MKRKTFYHISLSFPYFALILAGVFTYLAEGFDIFSSPTPHGILLGVLIFFSVSGIVWAPLYTWMVVAMLFWSRGKSAEDVRRMYTLSPLLLACSMGLPALLVSIPSSGSFLLWGFLRMNNLDFFFPILFRDFDAAQSFSVGVAWVFMAAICVVVGYTFVGIVLLIERTLKRRGLFKDEENVNGGI